MKSARGPGSTRSRSASTSTGDATGGERREISASALSCGTASHKSRRRRHRRKCPVAVPAHGAFFFRHLAGRHPASALCRNEAGFTFRMRLGSSPDDPTDRQIVRGNGEGLIARQGRVDAAPIAAVPRPGGTSSTGPVESWLPPLSGFAIAPSRSSGLPFPTPFGIEDNGGGELHPAREEV